MIIYYNAACSKCLEAKGLMEENNCSFEVREYLKVPPSEKEITELLQKLNVKAFELVRKSEPLFIEKFSGRELNPDYALDILLQVKTPSK